MTTAETLYPRINNCRHDPVLFSAEGQVGLLAYEINNSCEYIKQQSGGTVVGQGPDTLSLDLINPCALLLYDAQHSMNERYSDKSCNRGGLWGPSWATQESPTKFVCAG